MRGAGDLFHGGLLWTEVCKAEADADEDSHDRLQVLPQQSARVLPVYAYDGGWRSKRELS